MKKAAESKEKTKEKKARLATPCLGNFGFKIQKTIDGKTYTREIEEGQPLDSYKCLGCGKSFKNQQGLGKHKSSCHPIVVAKKQKGYEEIKNTTSIKDACQQTTSTEAKKHSAAASEHGERAAGFKNTVAVIAANNDSTSTNENTKKACRQP